MAKVRKTPTCWVWTGARHGHGYGHIRVRGKVEKAHRASWTVFRGAIPHNKHVLHKCDNMWCVNPKHLYLGTPLENAADRLERNPNSWHFRLTHKQVRLIRWVSAQPERQTFKAIGAQFGITAQHAGAIASGKARKTYRTRAT